MSNRLVLERTMFQAINAVGYVTETTFGYRIYDDYENHYTNIFDSLDELIELTPLELVNHARGLAPEMETMIYNHKEVGKPIFIDGRSVSLREEGDDDD